MTEREKSIALLERIATGIERLVAIAERRQSSGAPAAAVVADTNDLLSNYGNPLVRFDPRDWTGESCKGRQFSECPPAFLDVLAAALDYFAEKETDAKKAGYNRKDAARARGWAERIRSGKHQQSTASVGAGGGATAQGGDEWAADPSW